MSIVGSVSVRVVPSFTGMHKTIGQQFSGAGADAGRTFSRSMGASMDLRAVGGAIQGVGDRVSSLGGTLTKSITIPAAGAAAAVGGIVGAFGWGRLKSVDSAQAQLRGLGYSTEDVTRISGQLTEALEGGMLTMGEATSAAAAGMAAGVEEGQELTRYIELLDAATAGSNGTFDEMNQIFARIQGSGQLMTNELQMIEQRMPGFSGAAAEHFGVTQEALREMVSNGEISADEFLDIMDGFAGDMASEYAKSWDGMVQNTKAYIGILGENLLGGVFEQSKESIAEFIEYLSSDEVEQWATSAGEAIGDAFSSILTWVRGAIDWWIELDGSTKRMIGTFAAVAVAIGPILLVGGHLITFFGKLITNVGIVIGWFGGMGRVLGTIARAFRIVTGPIGWMITALILAWTYSESFREAIVNMGLAIWDAFSGIWDALQPAFSGLSGAMSGFGEITAWLAEILGDTLAWVIDNMIIPAIEWLGDALAGTITWLTDLGDETTTQGAAMTSTWGWIQGAIDAVVSWVMDTAVPWLVGAWENIVSAAQWMGDLITTVWDAIVTGIEWVWDIAEFIFILVAALFLWVGETFWSIWTNYIKLVWDTWVSIITWVWESILQPIFGFIVAAFEALGSAFAWVWDNVIKPMWDMFVAIVNWVWESIIQPIFNFIVQAFKNLGQGFMNVWNGFIKPVIDMVGAIIRWLWENVAEPIFGHIGDSWQIMADWLREVWRNVIRPMIDAFGDWVVNMWRNYIDPALGWISDKWDWLSGKLSDIWTDNIKPVLTAFGDFFTETLPGWVDKGVGMIQSAWNSVANAFRKPINWVINTVWNDGIAGAFDSVAKAVGSDTRMAKIPTIGRFGESSGNGRRGNIPGYADGGLAKRGLALVGEEGPELVDFRTPGRVYTADESQELLGGMGAPTAGATSQIARWFATSDNDIVEWGRDAAGNAIQWVRGRLADAAEKLMGPILDTVSGAMSQYGTMGQLGSGLVDWGWDSLLDWIRGEDEKAIAEGVYDGPFTANPGGFNRPMQGPITSRAGTRSYWGAFGNRHYGVDIGGPIGTAVRAMFSGVIRAISGGGNNRTVVMNHGGYDTAYMHMSAITRALGEQVSGGDVIARSGTAGSGPHGHFEYHPGGYYNPSMSAINGLIRDKGGLLYPGMNQVLNDTGQAEYIFNQRQFENLNKIAASGGGGEGWQITQNNYQSGNQYRDAQDLRMTFRRERRKAGV